MRELHQLTRDVDVEFVFVDRRKVVKQRLESNIHSSFLPVITVILKGITKQSEKNKANRVLNVSHLPWPSAVRVAAELAQ